MEGGVNLHVVFYEGTGRAGLRGGYWKLRGEENKIVGIFLGGEVYNKKVKKNRKKSLTN